MKTVELYEVESCYIKVYGALVYGECHVHYNLFLLLDIRNNVVSTVGDGRWPEKRTQGHKKCNEAKTVTEKGCKYMIAHRSV